MKLDNLSAQNKLKQVLQNLYRLSGNPNAEDLADQAVQSLDTQRPVQQDLRVRALKGGTYKIKEYYMENDALQDIRGASTLISAVQDKILPAFLREQLEYDSILYNGGGNILALVPADTDASLPSLLEQKANDILVTANSAYVLSEPFMLSDFLGARYHELQAELENRLSEHKKAKIAFSSEPESVFLGQKLLPDDERILTADELPASPKEYCAKCQKRIARYIRNGSKLCGGCLHKIHAGETQKSQYLTDYNAATGARAQAHKTLSEIDKEHIAVLYADGNNMGGMIQNLHNIAKMIGFSDFVKKAMSDIVFHSLHECGIEDLEIVALGGDDVFLIIPAKYALKFSIRLIRKYREEFRNAFPGTDSTLSVGFCIMKTNTPVKVALEVAEAEMKKAKKLILLDGGDGSLSFQVFNTYEGAVTARGEETLLPYSVKAAEQIVNFAEKLTNPSQQKAEVIAATKTQLQNFSSVFHQAEFPEEASLFLNYTNAKNSNSKNKIPIFLPKDIEGYSLSEGFYTRSGNYRNGTGRSFLWDDLINIIEFGK